jgi:hypothetical protein
MIERVDGGTATSTRAAGAPVVGWASGPLGLVQAADREIARQRAVKARAVAAFAASRPASVDRAQGERGAMSAERWAARAEVLRPISEWATPELAIALNLTRQSAEGLLEESLILVHRLPRVLEAGLLHAGHLWHLIDKVALIGDDGLRASVEADLLAWVARRHQVTTPAQLGDRARRVVARRDAAAAARRLAKALKDRGISIRPERAEGMAAVTVVCTMPEATALYAALGQCADALVDEPGGPVRTRGQKMVDALMELVLRPGEAELPPVRVLLTVVASVATLLGGDAPGEVDGELVPAEMARQLMRAFAGRDPAADTAGATAEAPLTYVPWQQAEQGELAAWWEEMERRLLAGELADEPERGPDLLPADEVVGAEDDGFNWLPNSSMPCPWAGDAAAPGSGAPPDGSPPDIIGSCSSPPPSSGSWADADRAVEDAGAAVHAARLALGHARRSVRTARKAEATEEAAWRAGPAGRVDAATDALGALAAAADIQRG